MNPVRKFGMGFKPIPNYNKISSPPLRTEHLSNGVKDNLKKTCIFLALMGLLRGILETIWIFLMSGSLGQLYISLKRPSWYLFECGPFLLANVTTAFFRWALFSFLILWAVRFQGRNMNYKIIYPELLRRTSEILWLYPLAVLPNYLYLFWQLPLIRFRVSEIFQPAIGIGQLITGAVTVFMVYGIAKRLFSFNKTQSVLTGLWVVLFDRASYIFLSRVFFNIPFVIRFSYVKAAPYSIILFVVLTAALTPLILRFTEKGSKCLTK